MVTKLYVLSHYKPRASRDRAGVEGKCRYFHELLVTMADFFAEFANSGHNNPPLVTSSGWLNYPSVVLSSYTYIRMYL